MKAISIRQPWAWLIVKGFKDIENRDWRTSHCGPVLIHAAKGMTDDEYWQCVHTCYVISRSHPSMAFEQLPSYHKLQRGGIVGRATIVDCVSRSASPWFFGPHGFLLTEAKELPFRPMRGLPGFFEAGEP